MRAYFCVLEVAISANRRSVIQGCRICNKMEEDGNSSYPPTPLNASNVNVSHCQYCSAQVSAVSVTMYDITTVLMQFTVDDTEISKITDKQYYRQNYLLKFGLKS